VIYYFIWVFSLSKYHIETNLYKVLLPQDDLIMKLTEFNQILL